MPVPPIAPAPTQTTYIVSGGGCGRHTHLCGAAAFGCLRLAKGCSGRNGGWKKFELVKRKSAHIDMPDTDYEWKRVLAAYQREQHRARVADEWEKKKRKTD
eukprot:scaffold200525_cov80-Attheya_sp.AAC.1